MVLSNIQVVIDNSINIDMRYLEFRTLLEYDRSKTIAALGGTLTASAERDNVDVDSVLDAAEQSDPTPSKQYVVWILRQYTKNQLPLDQFSSLTEHLRVFYASKAQHKRMGIDSDINRYDWRSISDVAAKLSSTEVDDTVAKDLGVPDAKVLYNGPLGILVIPESEAASCELGRGTEWCTAATKSQNLFSKYNDLGPLYIWIDQKLKKKFQFHFESFQFMDENDKPLSESQLMYFAKQQPVTRKLFANKQPQIDNSAAEYIDYLTSKREYDYDPNGYNDEYGEWEENQDWENLEPDSMFLLATPDLIKKNLKYIKRDPTLSYHYAKDIVKGAWPEGEEAILLDNYLIIPYAENVLKARWPAGEDMLLRRMHNDALNVAKYAKYVVGGPWKEAEERGKHYAGFVYYYSDIVLNRRWSEYEIVLAQNFLQRGGYSYINAYLKRFEITVDDLNISDDVKEKIKATKEYKKLSLTTKVSNSQDNV